MWYLTRKAGQASTLLHTTKYCRSANDNVPFRRAIFVRNRWVVLTLIFSFFAALSVRGARGQWRTPWNYEGPRGADHWSDLDPAYQPCNTGREQSPIDIRGTERAALPALQFEYRRAPL